MTQVCLLVTMHKFPHDIVARRRGQAGIRKQAHPAAYAISTSYRGYQHSCFSLGQIDQSATSVRNSHNLHVSDGRSATKWSKLRLAMIRGIATATVATLWADLPLIVCNKKLRTFVEPS